MELDFGHVDPFAFLSFYWSLENCRCIWVTAKLVEFNIHVGCYKETVLVCTSIDMRRRNERTPHQSYQLPCRRITICISPEAQMSYYVEKTNLFCIDTI
jgi:hypothetical protein